MRARLRVLVVLAVGLTAALVAWWSLRRASAAPAEPQVRQASALPLNAPEAPATEAEPPDAGECSLDGTVTVLRNGASVPPAEATVVVYVSGVRRKAPSKTVLMFQENRQFHPALLVLHTGDSLRFENRDDFDHSVFSNSGHNTFELHRASKGVTGIRSFAIPGAVRIQCDIHASMRADVLVLENEYFSVANAGAWRIERLPAGRYTLVAWEPNGGKTTRDVSACDGPVSLQVAESAPPELRRKSGDRYSSEYDSP